MCLRLHLSLSYFFFFLFLLFLSISFSFLLCYFFLVILSLYSCFISFILSILLSFPIQSVFFLYIHSSYPFHTFQSSNFPILSCRISLHISYPFLFIKYSYYPIFSLPFSLHVHIFLSFPCSHSPFLSTYSLLLHFLPSYPLPYFLSIILSCPFI